jgi:hypothetical protein
MKLYTATYQDVEDNTIVAWDGTQADHNKRMKALKKDDFVPKSKVVDFPLDKNNVLGFLNRFVTFDMADLIEILPTYESKAGEEAEA